MEKHGASVGVILPDESEGLPASEDEQIEEKPIEEELSVEELMEEDPSEEELSEDDEEPIEEELSEEEPVEGSQSEEEPSEEEPVEERPSDEESSEEELSEDEPSEEEVIEEEPSEEQSKKPAGKFVSEPAFYNGNDNKQQPYLNQSNSGDKERSAEPMGGHSQKKNKLEQPSRPEYESSPSCNYLEEKIKISKTISDQSTSKGEDNTESSRKNRHCIRDMVPNGDGEALVGDQSTSKEKDNTGSSGGKRHSRWDTSKGQDNTESSGENRHCRRDTVPKSDEEALVGDQSTSKGQDNTGSSGKKRHSRWDTVPEGNREALDGDVIKRRKTRWDGDGAQLKMLGPLQLPDFSKGLVDGINLHPEIQELNERLLEINQKLQAPEVVDDRPEKARSPSPLPIYNEVGIRINTREVRLRAKLVKQRQEIISELVRRDPNFKHPSDYKPPKLYRKLYLPVAQYPGYNFIGLIMGPRGNTQKRMEKESGARILLRGRGSSKKFDPSESEDLHVHVEADNQKSLDAAVQMVEKLLVPVAEGLNEHKRAQLRELAELKGTLIRKTGSKIDAPCNICCDASHPTSSCPLIAPAQGSKTDDQYASSIANLGDGLSPFSGPPVPSNASMRFCPVMGTLPAYNSKSNKEIDDANVYVCHLPQSVNDGRLVELFSPFGTISQSKVVKDKATGISKGYGFVRYTDPIYAAKAVKQMNGHMIDGNILAVRVADRPPIDAPAISCSNAVHPTFSCFSTAPTPGSKTDREIDDANLYVGYLPPSVNDDRLIELFSPFGTIRQSKVIKDKATGISKGYGFVMYADPISAAKAVEQMNGQWIDGKMMCVRVAGRPPINSSRISLLPTYPGHAAPVNVAQPIEFTEFPGNLSNLGSQFFSFQRDTSSLYKTHVSSSLVSTDVAQPTEFVQFPGSLSNVGSQYYSY